MSDLLIRGHLGLGDHLVCNAIVRYHASQHDQTVVLCKQQNIHSLDFMFRDERTVETFSIKDDAEADECVKHTEKEGFDILLLGQFSPPFEASKWDTEMYRQAGLDFQQRWNGFRCIRQPSREVPVPKGKFAFVHDDPKRGFVIDPSRLPSLPIVKPDPEQTSVIFDYWGILEAATEIHCIDSSFAILVDSLPTLNATKLVWHYYARKGLPPSYCKNWQRLE